ncbi:MAG: nucleoside hydrolase [Anaerolineaceae bacterium]|jgi:inosine-uridine nucleoside N-ribohydrolase|nr:nucleoside hydrolase [Anaerolineaceae bacterium]
MPQKIILDVDTGRDDAVAILMAGHHPALELAAVLAVHGNAPLETTLDNTLRTLEAGGLTHVPVYVGAEVPLMGKFAPTLDVQRVKLPLPSAAKRPENKHAVQFLIDYYMSVDGPETIYMPVGPQTNLAVALRIEPRIVERIPRIVTMGGAYLEGNTTPSAEFNILADPEAAHIVFTAGIPITMVGLEVTARALVMPQDVERIRDIGTPWAVIAADLMAADVQWFVEELGCEGGQIYDPCAVAAVIAPDVLTTKAMRVDIELYGTLTRGRTVADISGQRGWKPNVEVGVDMDRERFVELLYDGLR